MKKGRLRVGLMFDQVSTAWLNRLIPKSDLPLISPHNITPESHIKSHENKRNDHQLRRLLIVKQILPVSTLRNV